MFCVTLKMIKCSCRCYCSRNRGRLALHYHWQNWSKIKKKYINLRDPQNSATRSCWHRLTSYERYKDFFQLASRNLSFWDNRKIFFPVTVNSPASTQSILVFLSCQQVPGNSQKPKINYMATDGHNENFQV